MKPSQFTSRVIVGAIIGLVFYGVGAIDAGIRWLVHPWIAETATWGAYVAVAVYLPVFILSGAIIGYLSAIRLRVLRFILIGALIGAVLWNYLTLSWPLNARASQVNPPSLDVISGTGVGMLAGGLGGLLLFGIGVLRNHFSSRAADEEA